MYAARPFRLRLIHFNDLHGRLTEVGGDADGAIFSRIAGFVRRAREEAAKPTGRGRGDAGVLFLSGGDDLVGSPFADLAGSHPERFRCHPGHRIYSAAGVDAGGIGNHDLDWGLRMLSLAAGRDARFPLLSANLAPAPWAETDVVRPFVVLPINGLRVGIIGLTTGSEIKPLIPGEFEIREPLAATLDLLPQVKAASDLVIILSHLGYSAKSRGAVMGGIGDVELARALPAGAVAAIVGGHTHTVLHENGLDPAQIVNGTLIAQAGSMGRFVGDVTIEVTEEGARAVDARLWPVNALPEDREFQKKQVAPLAQAVRRLLDEPLGVVSVQSGDTSTSEGFGARELALANYVADALAARCRAAGLPVDFAMIDASTVGAPLPPPGPLFYGDIFRLSPYADSVVLLRLPARALGALIADNARRFDLPGEYEEERGFAQFSRELRYQIRVPPGRRAGRALPPSGFRARRRIRATDATLNGERPASVAARRDTLLVAVSSFLRQFAVHWQQRARRCGIALFDVEEYPREVTPLAVREELAAYAREAGGATAASGLRTDGRLKVLTTASRIPPHAQR
jgi:5'-nucleotidase/5'-nucleotidase/UDP-sugar diphosphatase